MSARLVSRSSLARRGAALVAVAALALTGCGKESDTTSDKPQETIKISITADSVSPMGERVEIPAGKPVPIEITADREGSLHVHSTPEQELDFKDGTTEHELTIDRPGIVEVEMHDPDIVVLQLEVR